MEVIAGAVLGGGVNFLIFTALGSIALFGIVTLISLPIFKRFRGIGPLDLLSRALAGGVFGTSVLISLIALYIAGYNLVKVPSDSFPFVVVLIICLVGLAIWMGPAVACAWLAAKWLLRPAIRHRAD